MATLILHLDRSLFTPIVYLPESSEREFWSKLGVELRFFPFQEMRRQKNPFAMGGMLFHLWRTAGKLSRAWRKEKVELVHANSYKALLYVGLGWRGRKIPCVCHFRDVLPRSRSIRFLIHRTVRKGVCVSQFIQSQIQLSVPTEVIYNPVEVAVPSLAESSSRPFTVANIGQMVPWKSQHEFLDMAERLSPQRPDLRFLMVGRSPDTEDSAYALGLKRRREEMARSGSLQSADWVASPSELWGQVDLLVHCATREPFGRVIAEAQCLGIPVLAAEGGGASELIESGEGGCLYPAGDITALSKLVEAVADKSDAWSSDQLEACEKSKERYRPETHARKMEQVFEEVLW